MRPSLDIPVNSNSCMYISNSRANEQLSANDLSRGFFFSFFPSEWEIDRRIVQKIISWLPSRNASDQGSIDTYPSRIEICLVHTQHLADYSFNVESTQAFYLCGSCNYTTWNRETKAATLSWWALIWCCIYFGISEVGVDIMNLQVVMVCNFPS